MKSKYYSRVCIVGTLYTLFLYLLISTQEEVENTFFYFSDGISSHIRKKFTHYYFPSKPISKYKSFECIYLLLFKFYAPLKWRFLKKAVIFGHDHLRMSPAIIRKNSITLIEDGLGNYNLHPYPHKISLFNKLQNGGFSTGRFGYNQNTKKILLTNLAKLSYEDSRIEFIKPQDLWRESDKDKKKRLLEAFDFAIEDLNILSSKEIILLTQPWDSEYISENEKINIYRKVLENYPHEKVVIKTHPREITDYQKYFPDILIFDKKIPLELLTFMGAKFKTAVSISSTAALSFNYDLQIDWIDTKISDTLFQKLGPSPFIKQ